MEKNESKVFSSLLWKFLERGGVQIVQFVISIVLARLLVPQDYGLIAIIQIFIAIATVFVQSGLSTALIQKKNVSELEISSVFIYSLVIAIIAYVFLFLAAPFIEDFYSENNLSIVLRIMALTLFPGAFNSIQIALVQKELNFRMLFFCNLCSAILSGIIGIIVAYVGFGVWALVVQQLLYQFFVCFLLMIKLKWRPKFLFSYSKTKGLLRYGFNLLGARLIDTIYHNLESLIIGKKYSGTELAYYNRGKQFPLIMIDNIDGSIQSVMLPIYSKNQDNLVKIKEMVRSTISLSTFFVFPAMIGLSTISTELILLILGDKWINSVLYLQLYCYISALFPLQTANLQAFNSIGRSDIYMKLITIKRILGLFILFFVTMVFDNAFSIVVACLFIEVAGVIINIYPNIKIFNYNFADQVRDILPNFICAILMGILINNIHIQNVFINMIIKIILGFIIYLIICTLIKNKNCMKLKDILWRKL